ncbi:hypothetical protein ACTHOQ_17850 [Solibacillus silvestris]|uniref:hypothetical protein n=1 Tax=Solibacillus silvestris TaxID=76853 RepID=UPI003F7DB7E1
MKKIVILLAGIALLAVGSYSTYGYVNERNIENGVVSKAISGSGMPVGKTMFAPEDTVYFSAKGNQFWIKKAQIIWYKGEIDRKNRIYVEEEVKISKDGYFTSKLSAPEDFEEGHYAVTIYADGSKSMATSARFEVKK